MRIIKIPKHLEDTFKTVIRTYPEIPIESDVKDKEAEKFNKDLQELQTRLEEQGK